MDQGVPLEWSTVQLALIVGSLTAWGYLFRRLRQQLPFVPCEERTAVPWSGWDVAFLAILAMILETAAQVSVADGNATKAPGVSMPTLVAVAASRLAWIALALIYLVGKVGARFDEIGGDFHKLRNDLRIGGLLFLAAVLPVYGVQVLFTVGLGYESDHPLARLVQEHPNVGVLVVVTVIAVVIAPLAEELLFRVILQGWLEKRQVMARQLAEGEPQPPGFAPTMISAMLFGLLHLGHGPDPIALFILGLFLGYAYRQTHRIFAPLAIHVCVNSLAVVELWVVFVHGAK